MSAEDLVYVIDKPHFIVKLHETLLEVDLKKGIKKELEDFLESTPLLQDSLGFLLQASIPLDIPLKDIESAEMDKKGQVKIAIPYRRDIIIPLEPDESKSLLERMNELILKERERTARELLQSEEAREELELRLAKTRAEATRRIR